MYDKLLKTTCTLAVTTFSCSYLRHTGCIHNIKALWAAIYEKIIIIILLLHTLSVIVMLCIDSPSSGSVQHVTVLTHNTNKLGPWKIPIFNWCVYIHDSALIFYIIHLIRVLNKAMYVLVVLILWCLFRLNSVHV